MEENKELSINELCKNLKFKNGRNEIVINNETDLLNYINKINQLAKDFKGKKFSINEIEENKDMSNKFISLFEYNSYMYYQTISNSIINTIEPPNNINIKDKCYNNVFVLNNILETTSKFCFEIKLGHGLWDNIYSQNDKNISGLKIGILKLKEQNLKDISNYLVYSYPKKLDAKFNWNISIANFAQKDYDILSKKYNNFRKYIYYYDDMDQFVVPCKKRNNIETKRKFQKNDVIGIVINSNTEYIKVEIFINGVLSNCRIISREENANEDNFSEIDDDYNIEQKKNENNILIPFIEIGPNNSIFIKDKPNNNNYRDILSNEKIEFYEKYNCSSLNDFIEMTTEIQKITDNYLDILNKIGNKIFNNIPSEIDKYFQQMITFFNDYVFNNNTILKNKFLTYLSNGINLESGNIDEFKEKIKALFHIIKVCDRLENQKTHLVELIVKLLIELIIESNFNLLNLNNNNKNENQIKSLKKYKFILCFILFDSFIQEDNFCKNIFNNESCFFFFKEEHNFMNFCYSIYNSCFYNDISNDIDYIKSFYNNDNTFNEKKFLETHFNKCLENNNLFDDFIQDYKFIFQNIKKNVIFQKNNIHFIFKFLSHFTNSENHISIINGIFIPLIQNYFENAGSDINKQINKLLFTNNIYENSNFVIPKKDEDTFLGKYDINEILKKHSVFSKIEINKNEGKDYAIFELILYSISNYYDKFIIKEKNAKSVLELLKSNKIDYENNFIINKLNHLIEFYQTIFSVNFYVNFAHYYGNYLIKIIRVCLKNNYLDIIPYKLYLKNILFILHYLYLRCSFIDKNNLLDPSEPRIISSILQNILKYTTEFLGKISPKTSVNKFSSKKKYEELISLHIEILIKVLLFDSASIKHSFKDIKENMVLLFKHLLELYDNDNFPTIYKKINYFMDFLYSDNSEERIDSETRKIFFKDIMEKEIEDFIKMEKEKKNSYIEDTMYYNIFFIIYKRMKNIRDSVKKLFGNEELFSNNLSLSFEKKYLAKFTQILNVLYNFFKDNKLNVFFDIRCIPFLKINSFISKTFKVLYPELIFKKLKKINEDDQSLIYNFFCQFLYILSILLTKEDQFDFDFSYKISKNRKGFHFEEFKQNFKKFFGQPKYKDMIDFFDILSKFFNRICKDEDTFEDKDMDDNSIEIDDKESCPICLDYTSEKDVHLTICNHVYHLNCLKSLLDKEFTKCALCKRPITGIKEDPSFKVNNSDEDENHPFSGGLFVNNNSTSNFLFSNNSPFRNNNDRERRFDNINNQTSIFSNYNDRHSPSALFDFNSINTSSSLFGNNSTSGGLFGNNNNNSSGTGLFGSINNNNSNGGGLFGNNNNSSGPTFGVNNNNLFGTSNNNSTGGGLFGTSNNNSNGGGLFGTNNNNSSCGGLFRTSNNNSSGGGLFGTSNNNSSGGGLFGTNNNNSSGGGLFGTNNNNSSGGGLFGTSNNNSTGGSLFGTNNNNSSDGGLFGTSNNNNNLFGISNSNNPFSNRNNNNSNRGGLFGNTNNNNSEFF